MLNQIQKDNFVSQQAYPGNEYDSGKYAHRELDKMLKAMLDVVVSKSNRKLSSVWDDAYKAVLDVYMGDVPEKILLKNEMITPLEFAKKEKFNVDDSVELTSFCIIPYINK